MRSTLPTLATQPPSLYTPGSENRTGSPGCHPNAVPSQLAPDADQATRACAPDRADCRTRPCNRCPRLAIPEYYRLAGRRSVQARAGDGHRWGCTGGLVNRRLCRSGSNLQSAQTHWPRLRVVTPAKQENNFTQRSSFVPSFVNRAAWLADFQPGSVRSEAPPGDRPNWVVPRIFSPLDMVCGEYCRWSV